MTNELTVRFRDFPIGESRNTFTKILELCFSTGFVEVIDKGHFVDVEITGPYSGLSDSYKTPLITRAMRGFYSKFTRGEHLSKPNLATGITPSSNAKFNLWYTGENQRPPYGDWDAYLSFDSKIPHERNFYLPLWLLTSTNWIHELNLSYWGTPAPKLENLLSERKIGRKKSGFACAFIGKNYPVRLHAIESLRNIGKVDVFGEGARNPVKNPSIIAQDYKFVLCFENDLYPGYVTEKPVEAYLCGAIPLYYGIDSFGYLNKQAIINLNDSYSLENWLECVENHHRDDSIYAETFTQKLLNKTPDLNELISFLRKRFNID